LALEHLGSRVRLFVNPTAKMQKTVYREEFDLPFDGVSV
jgi:hypothetical protein